MLAHRASERFPVQIKTIMRSEDIVTVSPEDPLTLAAQLLRSCGVRHLPVIRDNAVVGVLSERDILRHSAEVTAPVTAKQSVEKAMRFPAITIGPDESVAAATALMVARKIGCLPVVTPQGLVGIITTTDLLRHDLETALGQPEADLPSPLRAVMKPAVSVTPETQLYAAAALMSAHCIRHLPVVDRENKVVGIISDRDLRTAVGDPRRFIESASARKEIDARQVGDVMSKVVLTLGQDSPVTAAAEHLVNHGIGALPIVDAHRRLIGIVSYLDVIQALR
jgi:CBS domain-containing protein